ncbi:MAG TPA: SpoIIE family protein phosphatase [Gaiellaceae bacterium]|nr:SpoIIE family protein phosphatase [Gaiellaceae bacterium]
MAISPAPRPRTGVTAFGAADVEAVDALAESVGDLLAGGAVEESLTTVARAAAIASSAELALVRVASPDGSALVARAVWSPSEVLTAELQGSRVGVDDVPADEVDYDPEADGALPAAIRRASARAGAEVARVVPVRDGDATLATLEVYRSGRAFAPRERALLRLAAAHASLALALARTAVGAQGGAERARGSLEVLGDALAAGSDEAELAEHVVRLAAEAAGATGCLLWRVEPDTPPVFLAAHGFEGDPPELEAAAERVRLAIEQRDEPAEAEPRAGVVVALGEPPVGALELEFAEESAAAAFDPSVLSVFAARAAVGLRRTRRAQLLTFALRRSQTIVAVVSQAIARLSLSHTLETAVDRISELTASAHVAIYLRDDGGRLAAAASRGLRGSHADLAERLLELALGPFRSRGFLFIADMRRDPRLAGLEDQLSDTGVRRALVIPLVVHDEVIGALAVFKQRPRPYRPGEEGLLLALSSQLAVAVQNARLHERTKELGGVLEQTLASERKAARQLRALFEISHAFAHSLSLDATLDAVAKTMVDLFAVDAAAIRLPDERGAALLPRAIHVADPAMHAAASAILSPPQPRDEGLVARVLGGRTPVFLGGRTGEADPFLEPFLAKGSTAAVLPLATPGEAIGTLTLLSLDPARPLDDEVLETATAVATQAALAIDNARLYQQQKDFAEMMQRTLLPRELPAVAGLDVGHVYESSARVDVGGDVYDFLSLDDGRLAVVVGDVAGKGIQAAADMAMAKFAFRALARSYPEPPDFLARVNDVVIEEIALGKFITLFYAVVDPRTGGFACANAGHPAARLVRPDGKVLETSASGLALGIESNQRYEAERTKLDPGSSLVLFTDGVIEARRNGKLYGEGRLDAFLRDHAALPAQALADALVADCRAFGGGDIDDDCAVVVLRMAP